MFGFAIHTIEAAAAAAAIFFVSHLLAWLINRAGRRDGDESGIRPGVARFLARMVRLAGLICAVMVAGLIYGLKMAFFGTIVGALILAIGLAVRGRMASFVAGIQVLIFRPFEIGHKVTVAGQTGKVMDIGLFSIILELPSGVKCTVNNDAVVRGTMINYTDERHAEPETTADMVFAIDAQTFAPGTVYDHTVNVLRSVIADTDADDAAFRVVSFSKSQVEVGMRFNVPVGQAGRIKDEIREKAMRAFHVEHLTVCDAPAVIVQ